MMARLTLKKCSHMVTNDDREFPCEFRPLEITAFTSQLPDRKSCHHSAHMDEEFRTRVRSMKVAQLREAYPGETACHRSMLDRARYGDATVNDSLRPFKSFLLALGPRPNKSWTVDRIDPSDPEYAAGKVRWADKRQQANNRENTIFLSVRGQTRALTDWARQTGQPPNTIRQRLNRGWSHEEAVYPARRKRGAASTTHSGPSKSSTAESRNSWPDGITQSNWEPHYKRWKKALSKAGNGPYTRRLFALWVCRNHQKELRENLAHKYPEAFDPDQTSPDETPRFDETDPTYQRNLQISDICEQLQSEISREEWNLLQSLLRRIRQPRSPKEAADLMVSIMKSTRKG